MLCWWGLISQFISLYRTKTLSLKHSVSSAKKAKESRRKLQTIQNKVSNSKTQLSWIVAYITKLFRYDLVPKVKGLLLSWNKYLVGLSDGSNTAGWHIRCIAAFSCMLRSIRFCTGSDIPLVLLQTGILLKSKWKHSMRYRCAGESNTEGISTSWNGNLASHVTIAIIRLSIRSLGNNTWV